MRHLEIFIVRLPCASCFAAFRDLLGYHVNQFYQRVSCIICFREMLVLQHGVYTHASSIPRFSIIVHWMMMQLRNIQINLWQLLYIVLLTFVCFNIACSMLRTNKPILLFFHASYLLFVCFITTKCLLLQALYFFPSTDFLASTYVSTL
jgi:hypothetical protein